MKRKNYYLYKSQLTGEVLYLEYEKIKGYNVKPKVKVADAINVSKIIFVNPSLSEKLIRKKIEIKIRYLIKCLEILESDDSGNEGVIRNTLIEAENLRMQIINTYIKYLGNTYGSYSIKKIQIIINQLKIKLYNTISKNSMNNKLNNLYYLDEEEPVRGRRR